MQNTSSRNGINKTKSDYTGFKQNYYKIYTSEVTQKIEDANIVALLSF